jgi:type IV secretory pathway VirB10-like protein
MNETASAVASLTGFAGSIGTGLYIAKRIVAGYKAAAWEAKKRELGLDKDLPPPPPPNAARLPPPAAAAVLPAAPAPSAPAAAPPVPARPDQEMSRIALAMIEELQQTLRRQRESIERAEADHRVKDALMSALREQNDKNEADLRKQRISLDQRETELAKQATVIEGLRKQVEEQQRILATERPHEPRNDRANERRAALPAHTPEYRDHAGVRRPGDRGPGLRPQGSGVSRDPYGGKAK